MFFNGEKLSLMMKKRNMSNSGLYRHSNISKSYISELKRKIYSNPTIDVLGKMCVALRCSPNDILDYDFKKYNEEITPQKQINIKIKIENPELLPHSEKKVAELMVDIFLKKLEENPELYRKIMKE